MSTDKLQDGEHTLENGTVIKVTDGVASLVNNDGPKPLYDPGIKIDPRAKPNTIHAGLTKFSEGQEVEVPGGHIGRVVKIKDGVHTVTAPSTKDFSEDELKEVIPLDSE